MADILIACECSGIVRQAFRDRGHNAWSNDLKDAEDGSPYHIKGDARLYLGMGWDMLIAHPVCKRMTNAGVRWLEEPPPNWQPGYPLEYKQWDRERRLEYMWSELQEGADLFSAFWNADIPKRAIENPVMHKYAKALIENYEPQAQTVQPWWFGDETFKATNWWLKGLPPLVATNKLTPPKKGTPEHDAWSWVHRASPGPDREAIRSRFHPGMAAAMADQWGSITT